ncbi:S41 family peptidase [Emticicia agri]|uniref:Tail specific protease domain-containing protein n=1 Tax=Emticicia agri TaxID=2492393 RepID=A0A4Q5M2K6_9BACT|nr:S41 family peptidase [Emticicia agri]RYU96057.1 hypothetical protein EWM59_09175 [Emticicia agri]
MKYLLLPFILLLSYTTFSQQDCVCSKNFDFAYQKLKDNYAGWADKVRPDNQAAFDQLSAEIKEKAKTITNDRECYFHLKKWFDFFQDGHVFITPITPYTIDDSPDIVATRAAKVPVLAFNETSFMQYLKENESGLTNAEGIWESDDKAYRIGIVKDKKDPKKYTGFLLADRDAAWKTGKVKFEMNQISPLRYVTTYYYADFSTETSFTREVKNFLIMENLYKFAKVFPIPKEEVSDEDIKQRIVDFRIEQLDSETALFVLPPFTLVNGPEYIKEMISSNKQILDNSPNLIIDLRNNPGGDDAAYESLFPYINTSSIVRKGGVFRSTFENTVSVRHELEAIQSYPAYKERLSPKLQQVLQLMQANSGKFINGPDKEFRLTSIAPNPKKVAFLVNKNTASTAEQFILEAKQSKKTIVFGENTKGLADYIEVRDWGMPCYGWRVAFALAKSARLPQNPINNVGIAPDVKISEKEADWVEFVRNYLKK